MPKTGVDIVKKAGTHSVVLEGNPRQAVFANTVPEPAPSALLLDEPKTQFGAFAPEHFFG